MLLPFQPSTWPAMPVPYKVEVASGAVIAPFTTAPSTPAFWVPKEVTLLEPVVVMTPESVGTVVTVAALPEMLIESGEEVETEANVFTPVAYKRPEAAEILEEVAMPPKPIAEEVKVIGQVAVEADIAVPLP